MAEEKKTPEKEESPAEPVSKETPAEPLSDEDVVKLFANIGEEAAKPKEGDPENADDPPPAKADAPPASFDPAVLKTPEGQQAIQDAVQRAITDKAAGAKTDDERQKLQELIDAGNHEELGKLWQKQLESDTAGKTAVNSALETLYRELFNDPLFQNLTAEERKAIEPDSRFRTDAEYVKHLSKFMAEKQRGKASEEDIQEALNQKIEAKKRELAGKKARTGSVQGAAPAEGGTPSRPTDARSLISEGLRETFPEAYAQ